MARGFIWVMMSTVVANCHVVCNVAFARRLSEVIAVGVVERQGCAEDIAEWEEVVAMDVVRWRSSRGPRRTGMAETNMWLGHVQPPMATYS